MEAYKYAYIAVTLLFTSFLLRIVFIGFESSNYASVGIAISVGVLLWIGTVNAGENNRRALIISSFVPGLLSMPIVYRLFERARFISENGGMERADGYGSPLAFLIGLIFESLLLAPLVCLFIVGLYFYIRKVH